MLEAFFQKLMFMLIEYFLSKAQKEATEYFNQKKKDEELGKVNDENTKKYLEATARADRISAATNLLNRTR